ncbi:MAG: hypothetical protein IKP96_00790 [Elusimicrobiaceae bacterium]|nr:hypothetical protein [Elusimicrobiaceae bacterium]
MMVFCKRAAVVLVLMCLAVGLRAFDVIYGSLFQLDGVSFKNGRPVLPLTRARYANVRVLDKATFEWLKTCPAVCRQKDARGNWQIVSFRAAKTRPDMWIADVAIDEKWQLTFLIFKNKDGFSLVTPKEVTVLDAKWFAHIEKALQTRIMEDKE